MFYLTQVPNMFQAEPGPPRARTLGTHTLTVWDRWELRLPREATLGFVLDLLRQVGTERKLYRVGPNCWPTLRL